jgi:hypothetical protein
LRTDTIFKIATKEQLTVTGRNHSSPTSQIRGWQIPDPLNPMLADKERESEREITTMVSYTSTFAVAFVAPSIPGDEIQTVQEQRSSSRTTLIAE